jgi:hypothetical protein
MLVEIRESCVLHYNNRVLKYIFKMQACNHICAQIQTKV